MPDHLSPEGRSRNMAAIRSKDTKPELAMRAALREAGATGYRLHRRDLPGRPDIAFIRWKVAVFVDGAYWHGHPDHIRPGASDYWVEKIRRTQARDRAADEALAAAGWRVVRVWDTEVQFSPEACRARVIEALAGAGWKPPAQLVAGDREVHASTGDRADGPLCSGVTAGQDTAWPL